MEEYRSRFDLAERALAEGEKVGEKGSLADDRRLRSLSSLDEAKLAASLFLLDLLRWVNGDLVVLPEPSMTAC